MLKRLLLGSLLGLTVVGAPTIASAATMTDSVMMWQTYNITPGGNNKWDMSVYFTKQYWANPNWGLYAMYNTSQSGTVRGMYKTTFGDAFTLTGMAGLRATGITSSSTAPGGAFKQGPEVALTLAKGFANGWSVNVLGSYARLFEMNPQATAPSTTLNTGEANNLIFYGANIAKVMAPGTTVSLGVLGNELMGSWTKASMTDPKSHNFGPTLTFTQAF